MNRYMRLDTDSYVLEPYHKDPFAYMVRPYNHTSLEELKVSVMNRF